MKRQALTFLNLSSPVYFHSVCLKLLSFVDYYFHCYPFVQKCSSCSLVTNGNKRSCSKAVKGLSFSLFFGKRHNRKLLLKSLEANSMPNKQFLLRSNFFLLRGKLFSRAKKRKKEKMNESTLRIKLGPEWREWSGVELAFALLNQQPRVRLSAFPRIFQTNFS